MLSVKSLKTWSLGLGLLLLLSPLLVSCRASYAPQPPSTSISPSASPSVAPIPAITISPTDAAWDKVIQAAKREGKIELYSYNMASDIGVVVAREFEQKYGIKIEIISGSGYVLSERVLTERRMKVAVADIVDTGSSYLLLLKDAGATISMSELPVLQEKGVWRVDPWASDADRHILLNTVGYATSWINTDVVKAADEPKSFRELSQPKWKGKIVDHHPGLGGGSSNFFNIAVKRGLINAETVRAIGPNVTFVPNIQDAVTAIIQGRYSLYPMLSVGVFVQALKMGAIPVKPIAWEEGALVTNRAMTAIKDSPHPNATKLLINWLLTNEGQAVLQKAASLLSVRNDVPDFTHAAVRFTPKKIIAPTLEEEKDNAAVFKEGWLAKLWNQ